MAEAVLTILRNLGTLKQYLSIFNSRTHSRRKLVNVVDVISSIPGSRYQMEYRLDIPTSLQTRCHSSMVASILGNYKIFPSASPRNPKANLPLSEPCIRGHRATSCKHTDRVLVEVRKPGRPLQTCGHKLDTCSCGRLADAFSLGGESYELFLVILCSHSLRSPSAKSS